MKNLKYWICTIVGWLLILDGLFIMISWWTHSKWLIHLFDRSPPVSFNTGVMFFLLGLSFLWNLRESRLKVSKYLGIVIFFFGFTCLLEYIFHIDLHIDQVFLSQELAEMPFPGRPALLTCLSFMSNGLALSIYSYRSHSWVRICIAMLGLAVFWSVLLGFLNYFQPLEIGEGLFKFNSLAFQTAFGLFISSIGILTLSFEETVIENLSITKWFPYLVGGTFLIFIFFLYKGLISKNLNTIHSLIESEASIIEASIADHLQDHIKATQRMLGRLKQSGMRFDKAWYDDAQNYINDTFEFKTIGWVNEKLIIEHEISLESNAMEGTPLLLDYASVGAQGSLSYLVRFNQQQKTLLIFVPLFNEGQFLGGLFDFLDSDKFFEETFKHSLDINFAVRVEDSGVPVYTQREPARIIFQKEMALHDFKMNVIVGLTQTEESSLLNLGMIYLVLGAGILLSVFLGGVVYFWQSNVDKLREIRKIKKRLDLALSAASHGIWNWRVEDDHFFCDEITSRLMGIAATPFEGKFVDFINSIESQDKEKFSTLIRDAAQNLTSFQAELHVMLPDHTVHFLEFKGKAQHSPYNHQVLMGGICWDATEVREVQSYLETDLAITRILRDASSIEKAAPAVLQELAESLGFEAGALWLHKKELDVLECIGLWTNSSRNFPNFIKSREKGTIQKRKGLPWKVYGAEQFVWVRDDVAPEAVDQLRGVLGIYIGDQQGGIGVIELYKTLPLTERPTASLIDFISAISLTLAQFYRRSKNEEGVQELASIVKFSKEAILSKDITGCILSWNKGAEEMFGYSAEEMVGSNVSRIYPSEKKEEQEWIIGQIKQGIAVQNLETTRIRKDGQHIPVMITVSPIQDHLGNIIQACDVMENIEKLKKAELILKENEEKFRAFVETTSEWIWAMDQQRKITYSNPSIKMILGYEPQEIQNTDATLLIETTDRDLFEKSFTTYSDRKKGWVGQTLRWRHKDGSYRWLESNAEAIVGSKGEFLGFRGADRDITERKKLEKVKNEFISIVSHELRTPLTAITGALGLVLGRPPAEIMGDLPKLLGIAQANTERLSRIIEDILDIQKIESGIFELKLDSVDLKKIVEESIKINATIAAKFDVTIIAQDLPGDIKVRGDEGRLIQVMNNLLSNAIKFSNPAGKVYISIEKKPPNVIVSVKDEGRGIADEIKPKIFEKFMQGDSSSSRAAQGTGLGLAICKTIIEQHKGKISFASKVGQGTTFFLELPLIDPLRS